MSWLPKNKVVVPIDFSDQSLEAVTKARELVEDPSHLYVLHVLPVLSSVEPGVVWDSLNDENRCEHAESRIRERFDPDQYADVHIKAIIGEPGHKIAEFAESIGADLIMLPSHGHTGLRRLLIGSVAERVVRFAHCPVLVLRD